MFEARSGVHGGKLVVVLLASAAEQLLAELQDGPHVHGAEVKQVLVERALAAVFLLLYGAIAVFDLGVTVGLRLDLRLDGLILRVGVEAFGICDDAS